LKTVLHAPKLTKIDHIIQVNNSYLNQIELTALKIKGAIEADEAQ